MKNKFAKLALLAALIGAFVPSSQATLSNLNTQTITALGTGAVTNYTIGFVFQDNDEVRVYRRSENTSPATITEILQGVGAGKFTITGGDPGTTVVMGTAPSTTQRLVIKRVTPKTQGVQYDEASAFPAADHEEQMDRFAQMVQEVGASTATKIGLAEGSTSAVPIFPEPTASAIVGWNVAGTQLENKTPSAVLTAAGGLAAANNLSDVANPATSVSNLGLPAAANIYTLGGTDVAIADGGTGASSKTAAFDALSPLTTKGDLIAHNGTNNVRCGVGANGLIATADSSAPCGFSWAANASSVTGTANYVAIYSGAGALSEEATLAKSRGGSGQDNSSITFPASGTLTTNAGAQALTNKTYTIGTANRALVTDGSGNLSPATTTDTEIGYVNGVTSAIQTQLNAKPSGTQYPSIAGLTGAAYGNAGVLSIESALASSRGGTGFSTYVKGDTLVASATNTITKTAIGTTGQVWRVGTGGTGEWGAGGGSGGINFVGLDSTWVFSASNDVNGDTSVGNWVAYADAAATTPVDMTGGSPNTTCVRNSTGASVLNGSGSLEMVLSSAGSRQGEGCSVLTYVPVAYRGQTITYTFPFKLAGINVEDDIRVFAYDVTNSELITPYTASKIVGGQGQLVATFATKTTTAQMRIGLHVARTSTGQLSVLYDDVSVGPVASSKGMAGSDSWDCSNDIDFTSAGTVTSANKKFTCSRRGDKIRVQGDWLFAAVPASALSVDMASKYNVDYAKLVATSANKYIIGTWTRLQNGISLVREDAFLDGTDLNSVFVGRVSTGTTPVKLNSSTEAAINDGAHIEFEYPVAGWSANVTMAESSTFRISSYLANGSRVTAVPTLLGQYRSYLRTANSQTLTETNGAPTFTPTAGDGFRLYNGAAYTSADTNAEPTGYDIFVGKYKTPRLECYASLARTGYISIVPENGVTVDLGYSQHYDPSTGIFALRGFRYNTSTATHSSGLDAANGAIQDPYCDIIVSENALAVGISGQTVTSPATGPRRMVSAKISSAGVVSNESGDWISGSCAVSSTSIFDCTVVGGIFSAAPNCVVGVDSATTAATYLAKPDTVSTTSTNVRYRTNDSAAGTASAQPVVIMCEGAQ